MTRDRFQRTSVEGGDSTPFRRRPVAAGVWIVAALLVAAYAAALAWTARSPGAAGSGPEPLEHRSIGGLAPPGAWSLERADLAIERALARLGDRDLPPRDRVLAYRSELQRAESHLLRSLAARPTDSQALARLAAVRWELTGGADAEALADIDRLMAAAAARAPGSATVSRELGELCLKMGRPDPALRFLREATRLDPTLAAESVRLLDLHGVPAETIRSGLPPWPAVLVALSPIFVEEGRGDAFLEALEAVLAGEAPGMRLLLSTLERRSGAWGRDAELHALLSRRAPFVDPGAETERWIQMSRISARQGRPDRAVREAEAAVASGPDDPLALESRADALISAGRLDEGRLAMREAVAGAGRGEANTRLRARLYAKSARLDERLGHTDRAFDLYRIALELDPDQRIARERVERIDAAFEDAESPVP